MTEPNVVRTRRQRIEIGNPGTWSGPLPVRYSKSNFFFSKCVVMRRDLYIPRRDRSKMRHDRYYIKTTVFMIQYCQVQVHFQVRRDASRSMHTASRSFINASRSMHKGLDPCLLRSSCSQTGELLKSGCSECYQPLAKRCQVHRGTVIGKMGTTSTSRSCS